MLSQEYIGTIDPVKGLLPKKVVVKTGVNDALVEYGLSYFMYKRFNRELKRSLGGTIVSTNNKSQMG